MKPRKYESNFYEELDTEVVKTDDAPADDTPADEKPADEVVVTDDADDDVSADEDDQSEADKPAKSDPRNQKVPFSKFQKELNRRKEVEAELEKLKKPAEQDTDKVEDDDDSPELTPESRKALAKFLKDPKARKELGLVTKADIDADKALESARKQADADIAELGSWAETQGFPKFDAIEVDKWADTNLGENFVKNKATLKAAYLQMHEADITKAVREGALAEASSTRDAVAERPGAGAQAAATDDKPKDVRSAISAAMKKIQA